MRERIIGVKNWFQEHNTLVKESKRFDEFFPKTGHTDGVLTKPGEDINPLLRGLITAERSLSLIMKVNSGKLLSEKERRSVREAAWLNSISGNYQYMLDEHEELTLKICIENPEVYAFLLSNIEYTIAFFNPHGKQFGFKEASLIRTEENDKCSIIFNFPQIKKVKTVLQQNSNLYIYTKSKGATKKDRKISRLNLLLLKSA